jgi:hypothetical protein
MYLLAEIFPWVKRVRIPFNRDQWMLLMAAMNEFILGVDTYLAHSISGTIRSGEWVPIIFGPIAGLLLFAAGLIALRRRILANLIASGVFMASVVVGILGSYFHLQRIILTGAPVGEQLTAQLIVFGPPVLGPLTFALVAILGISAAWQEAPPDSGRLHLFGKLRLQMPLSKTRAYFFLVAVFVLVTLLSSVIDHAKTNFENTWLWIPTIVGSFAVLVTTAMGAYARLDRGDLITYLAAMALLVVVGLVGAVLHIQHNLVGQGTIVDERFIRGAPLLAPLLYANMALLGVIVLLAPETDRSI